MNVNQLKLLLIQLAEKENQKLLERKRQQEEEERQEQELRRHLEAERRQIEEEQRRIQEKKVSTYTSFLATLTKVGSSFLEKKKMTIVKHR